MLKKGRWMNSSSFKENVCHTCDELCSARWLLLHASWVCDPPFRSESSLYDDRQLGRGRSGFSPRPVSPRRKASTIIPPSPCWLLLEAVFNVSYLRRMMDITICFSEVSGDVFAFWRCVQTLLLQSSRTSWWAHQHLLSAYEPLRSHESSKAGSRVLLVLSLRSVLVKWQGLVQ